MSLVRSIKQFASAAMKNRVGIYRFVHYHLWWLVVVLSCLLLLLHSIKNSFFVVDGTSLMLLAIILVAPVSLALKKLKISGFEAEIGSKEVGELADETQRSIPGTLQEVKELSETKPTVEYLQRLVNTDSVLALAKIRIETETYLRKIHLRTSSAQVSDPSRKIRLLSPRQMVGDLQIEGTFTPALAATINDVMSICNRAIHGEDIKQQDAHRVVTAGAAVIEELANILKHLDPLNPVKKSIISAKQVADLRFAHFRVVTVVPYVDNPEERVYELSQDGLNAFLEGYADYGEFLVRIEPIS